MTALLEVTDLVSRYGRTEAVRGVSFEVQPGEIVALLGSNGAGKTTALRTITGLHRAAGGTVRLDGEEITRTKAHDIVARGFSHVPEGRRIFPGLSVSENLVLGGYLARKRKSLVDERRDSVYSLFPRLAERRSQLAGLMSGGEQQMLAIGRALMSEPKLLALDEPTMGLAPIVARQMLSVVRDIRSRGMTVLLVEQSARLALQLADRAYVLVTGQVELSGVASELAKDPRVQAAYLGGDPVTRPTA